MQHLYSFQLPIVVNCGDPGTPANGNTFITTTTFDSVVNHTCNEGFILNGASQRTCLENSSWSDSLPTCNRKFIKIIYTYPPVD